MIAMTFIIVSRCRVFQFFRLGDSEVRQALNAALKDVQRGLGSLNIHVEEEALEHWVQVAAGDVRTALNALELAALTTPTGADGIHITRQIAEDSIQKPMLRVDETLYYDMLSAFASPRAAHPDAASLWAACLLYAGCTRADRAAPDRHASEDVAWPIPGAGAGGHAAQALEFVGLPEARLAITQAIIYICMAPKSNTAVNAMDAHGRCRGQLGEVPVAARHAPQGVLPGQRRGLSHPHDFSRALGPAELHA